MDAPRYEIHPHGARGWSLWRIEDGQREWVSVHRFRWAAKWEAKHLLRAYARRMADEIARLDRAANIRPVVVTLADL